MITLKSFDISRNGRWEEEYKNELVGKVKFETEHGVAEIALTPRDVEEIVERLQDLFYEKLNPMQRAMKESKQINVTAIPRLVVATETEKEDE